MTSALIVVDMLNDYEHDDAEQLTQNVETIVEPVSALIARAGDQGVELIYVNDNYGDWNSSQGSWRSGPSMAPGRSLWSRSCLPTARTS